MKGYLETHRYKVCFYIHCVISQKQKMLKFPNIHGQYRLYTELVAWLRLC